MICGVTVDLWGVGEKVALSLITRLSSKRFAGTS